MEVGELLAAERQKARRHEDLVVGREPVQFVVHRRAGQERKVPAQVQDAQRIARGHMPAGIDRDTGQVARAAQGAAAVDADGRIRQPAIDDQFALADRRRAGVGVGAGQVQRACASLEKSLVAGKDDVDRGSLVIHSNGGSVATGSGDLEREHAARARVEDPVVGRACVAEKQVADRVAAVHRDGRVGSEGLLAEIGGAIDTIGRPTGAPVSGRYPSPARRDIPDVGCWKEECVDCRERTR